MADFNVNPKVLSLRVPQTLGKERPNSLTASQRGFGAKSPVSWEPSWFDKSFFTSSRCSTKSSAAICMRRDARRCGKHAPATDCNLPPWRDAGQIVAGSTWALQGLGRLCWTSARSLICLIRHQREREREIERERESMNGCWLMLKLHRLEDFRQCGLQASQIRLTAGDYDNDGWRCLCWR